MHIKDITKDSKKLSEELRDLAEQFEHQAVTINDVIEVLEDRAYTLLMIMLVLPFCAPVTPPGMSTPLGLVVAVLAGRFALGLPPWLPQRLLQAKLPPRFFRTLLKGAGTVIGIVERVLKPRLLWLTDSPRLIRWHALMVCLAAVILLIPAPIPFSNTLPALGVLLGACGVMERDGWSILAGYLFAFLGAAYFVLIAYMGTGAWTFIRDKLAGLY